MVIFHSYVSLPEGTMDMGVIESVWNIFKIFPYIGNKANNWRTHNFSEGLKSPTSNICNMEIYGNIWNHIGILWFTMDYTMDYTTGYFILMDVDRCWWLSRTTCFVWVISSEVKSPELLAAPLKLVQRHLTHPYTKYQLAMSTPRKHWHA